jgi:PilZ domain
MRCKGAKVARLKRSSTARAQPTEELVKRTRVSLIRRATLIVDGHSEDALIIDLGLRGVFLERAVPLPIGTSARVRFHLPGNELPLEAECRVAWHHAGDSTLRSKQLPPGLGLEFVKMPASATRRLHAYLTEHFGRHPRARQFSRPWIDEDEEPTE